MFKINTEKMSQLDDLREGVYQKLFLNERGIYV
mgnify:CR=1 FL=1